MYYFELPHHVRWETVSINNCHECAIVGDNISITWLEKTRAVSCERPYISITWLEKTRAVSCERPYISITWLEKTRAVSWERPKHKFVFSDRFGQSFPKQYQDNPNAWARSLIPYFCCWTNSRPRSVVCRPLAPRWIGRDQSALWHRSRRGSCQCQRGNEIAAHSE